VGEMGLIDYIKDIMTDPSVVLIGAITVIDIAPIKINPWKALLKWIGKNVNGEMQVQIANIGTEVKEIKRDYEQKVTNDMRWGILHLANTCRQGVEHSKDEWRHVMDQVAKYEDYTERKGITNGVIEEDTRYLRELYHKRNVNNDFL